MYRLPQRKTCKGEGRILRCEERDSWDAVVGDFRGTYMDDEKTERKTAWKRKR